MKRFKVLMCIIALFFTNCDSHHENSHDVIIDMNGYERTNRIHNINTATFLNRLCKYKPGDIDDVFKSLSEKDKKEILAYYIDAAWDTYAKSDTDLLSFFTKEQQIEIRRSFIVVFYETEKLIKYNFKDIVVPMEFGDKIYNDERVFALNISYDAFCSERFTNEERISKFAHEIIGHGIMLRFFKGAIYNDVIDEEYSKYAAPSKELTVDDLARTLGKVSNKEREFSKSYIKKIKTGRKSLSRSQYQKVMQTYEGVAISVEGAVYNTLMKRSEKSLSYARRKFDQRKYENDEMQYYIDGVKKVINKAYNIDGLGGIFWAIVNSTAVHYGSGIDVKHEKPNKLSTDSIQGIMREANKETEIDKIRKNRMREIKKKVDSIEIN